MGLAKSVVNVAAGAGATVHTGAGGLYGLWLRENTAVAAAGTVQVYDNTSAAGTIIATVRLAANGNSPQLKWKQGVRFNTGLHVVATGADINGFALIGSPGALRAVPFAGADLLLHTGATELVSVLAAETAAAAAEWRLYDALSITGTSFVGLSHTADATHQLTFDEGVKIGTGLQYDQVAGAVSGNVYIR